MQNFSEAVCSLKIAHLRNLGAGCLLPARNRLFWAGTTIVGALLLTSCGGSHAANTYSIGVNVSGLSGTGLVLQTSTGDTLAVSADGAYTFATRLSSGTSYQVTVQSQPASPQEACTVTNGSGTIGGSSLVIGVACVAVTHSIGVTVTGLSGTGLVLQLNGGSDLPIVADGTATFSTPIDSGANYAVTVGTQPAGPVQMCSVTNGSGTVGAADISDIDITCTTTVLTLYSFTGTAAGSSDGAGPQGSLVQGADGNLYGTTKKIATVFRITTGGAETTLYSFPPTCAGPNGGLILASDGNFYGTTGSSSFFSSGSMYQITPAGAQSTIVSFVGEDEQDHPVEGGVIQGTSGLFYLVAFFNQAFAISPAEIASGSLAPIFDYDNLGVITPDGVSSTSVQARDGNLYAISENHSVLKMALDATSGAITAINSIGSIPSNFDFISTPLIDGADGNLYGTTSTGGTPSTTCPQGCGTVYKITPSGVLTVLYSFGASAADGKNPAGALLLASDGNFYGTTSAGGSPNTNCSLQNGCGTLYRITPSGLITILYSFGTNASDGVGPSGALLQASDGNLYGTTSTGGPTNSGTVFKAAMIAN